MQLYDHTFFQSIHSIKCPFFYSSFSSNHLGAKSLVRHGMEFILSPNQQGRPLPSLLSDISSMGATNPAQNEVLEQISFPAYF